MWKLSPRLHFLPWLLCLQSACLLYLHSVFGVRCLGSHVELNCMWSLGTKTTKHIVWHLWFLWFLECNGTDEQNCIRLFIQMEYTLRYVQGGTALQSNLITVAFDWGACLTKANTSVSRGECTKEILISLEVFRFVSPPEKSLANFPWHPLTCFLWTWKPLGPLFNQSVPVVCNACLLCKPHTILLSIKLD